jgi:hypothetical protein
MTRSDGLTLSFCVLSCIIAFSKRPNDESPLFDQFNIDFCNATGLNSKSPFISDGSKLNPKAGKLLARSLLSHRKLNYDNRYICCTMQRVKEWAETHPELLAAYNLWAAGQMCTKNGWSRMRRGMLNCIANRSRKKGDWSEATDVSIKVKLPV